MMTQFHATGVSAGTPNTRSELRTPVTTPVIPRMATIGNSSR